MFVLSVGLPRPELWGTGRINRVCFIWWDPLVDFSWIIIMIMNIYQCLCYVLTLKINWIKSSILYFSSVKAVLAQLPINHTCTHVLFRTHTHIYSCVCIHTHWYSLHARVHVHAHMCACTHTYTHIPSQLLLNYVDHFVLEQNFFFKELCILYVCFSVKLFKLVWCFFDVCACKLWPASDTWYSAFMFCIWLP